MIQRFGERGRWNPFTPAVKLGNRVFAGSILPTDWESGLLPSTRPDPAYPFHSDPLAVQSEAALDILQKTLGAAGATLGDVARLTQWFTGEEGWPQGSEWSGIVITRYMEARSRRFSHGVPASVAVAVRRLPVTDALLGLDTLAVIGEKREVIGITGRPYPSGLKVGGMVHLSGELPFDWQEEYGSTVTRKPHINADLWYGYPVRSQTELLLKRLSQLAEEAGTDLTHAVHATVFLADRKDLFSFEEIWRKHFHQNPPARTVVTGAGLACRGCKVEVALDLLSSGTPKLIFPPGLSFPPVHESPAVIAGNLLYISGQMAVGRNGANLHGLRDTAFPSLCNPMAAQLQLILERVKGICEAARTSLDNLLFVRLFFKDLQDFGAALHIWEEAFDGKPPAGSMVGVGYLPVPGCEVMMDAIAYVPGVAQGG